MVRRQAAQGHSVRVSAETYARSILAAAKRNQHVNDFAERALFDALAIHDRQEADNDRRTAWRSENGTSTPPPMREPTRARPSDGFTPRRSEGR